MKLASSKYDIVTDSKVIATAAQEVANIRGIYGDDTHITLYIHSTQTFERLKFIEGYRDVPFECDIVVDPVQVPDPVGVAISYRRTGD